jgi:putative transposase
MPEYRRYYVPGGTIFFTVVTHERRDLFSQALARDCLRYAIETIRSKRPFDMPAFVLLPDHLHCLWTLPPGDSAYSVRWRRIKEEFTKKYMQAGGSEGRRSASRRRRKERGIWQQRFWEHTIEDEHDFERHFDYIRYNPVKHGCVDRPCDWPYSSFHRWVDRGVYPIEWGRLSDGPLDFDDLDETEME